jgi:hypothetical protein
LGIAHLKYAALFSEVDAFAAQAFGEIMHSYHGKTLGDDSRLKKGFMDVWGATACRSDATTTDEPQDDGNHGDDKKEVNQASKGIGGKEPEEPENDQKNRNSFKHSVVLSGIGSRVAPPLAGRRRRCWVFEIS